MLRTDLPSHRRSAEPQLVEALAAREPLALAEACSRTLPVAFAVARRLMPTTEAEPLLLAVYEQLWASPPSDVSLERWVRARTSAIGLEELRRRGAAPAAPSVITIAPDLPEPSVSYLDTTERILADLDEEMRLVLLSAHDRGVPSSEQDVRGAGATLAGALRALADVTGDDTAEDDVEADGLLADWVLGLLPAEEAAALEAGVTADPVRTARVQILRRGRRRIEGLPPTPDLGPRLLAAVLSGASAQATASGAPASEAADGEGTGETEAARAPERDDSVLGPLDDADPAVAGDLVASDVVDGERDGAEPSVLGPSPTAPGQSTEDLGDLSSALRDDPYAELRAEGDEARPEEPGRDPYAALRDQPTSADEPPASSAIDPDDPFADLREDIDEAGRAAHHHEADEHDEADYADAYEDAHPDAYEERGRRSGLVRLLQAIGILALIAGGIGLGLLIGQLASTALRG